MRKLNVYLKENPLKAIHVGTLAETKAGKVYFEYDSSYLKTGFNISPFKLNFTSGIQENKDSYPRESFGVFNDSLPDGWGMLLMDRFFRKHNKALKDITIIDRLAYIGERGMGALTYEPASEIDIVQDNLLDLHKLSENSIEVLQGKTDEILPVMAKAGGSPGGARPKILVGFNGTELISGESELPDGYEHWLIKFRNPNDFTDAAKLEYVYAQMAKLAHLNIPEVRLFSDKHGNSYFGIKRFDRKIGNTRKHVLTLGNMIHADFRMPSIDYETLLRVTLNLTKNYEDAITAFRMMVFNIAAHNRDDHSKNFAFIMNSAGTWSLAPSYDLTFSLGPGGEHTTSVSGNGRNPSSKEILKLASLIDLKVEKAKEIISETCEAVKQFTRLAKDIGITRNTTNEIYSNISALELMKE
ncbi:MAG TPA: type II toxin-antitoxin system HipA family toxin [Lentisphaeria bacterium]|nr:MAG: hypothetical protein A2X47_12995 [Lentisphaerae bacterium GWF2_38_69]HBM16029.1 type II toxin-antitoxin system HipA family toxin [Lentisphaeria bacterium]